MSGHQSFYEALTMLDGFQSTIGTITNLKQTSGLVDPIGVVRALYFTFRPRLSFFSTSLLGCYPDRYPRATLRYML